LKLLDHLFLVASGDVGLSLTSPLDCNVYLIDTGQGVILIDAGSNYHPEMMDGVIASMGFAIDDIKIILLTHYHADHCCGAQRLYKMSGACVYAPEKEAQAIIDGDADQIGLTVARNAGYVYPDGYEFVACPKVIPLCDGQAVSLGDVTVTGHAIPGHSLQDMVYHSKIDGNHCLFTGDSLFPTGMVLLQNLPDVCIYDYSVGLKKLSRLPVDVFLPGHREPSLSRGKRHLEAAIAKFDGLLLPAQLL